MVTLILGSPRSEQPAPLAQSAEQLTLNQWVLGSSPRGCTDALGSRAMRLPRAFSCAATSPSGPPLRAPSTVADAAPISAAPVAKAKKAKTFKNCTALSKVYKGGVAKAGVKANKVGGKKKRFTVKPTFSSALYKANAHLDRDKDGVACEKRRGGGSPLAALPSLV